MLYEVITGLLDERGVDLNMPQLLLFAAVFGMGGSFVYHLDASLVAAGSYTFV